MPKIKRNMEQALSDIEEAISDAQMCLDHLYDEEEAEELTLDAINGALKFPVPFSSIDQVVQCIKNSMTPSEEQVVKRINDALTDKYVDNMLPNVAMFKNLDEIIAVIKMAQHLVSTYSIYSVESEIISNRISYDTVKLTV